MAGANDIKAGGAYVELGAKDKGLADKMRAAEARVKAFGAGIMSVGRQVTLAGLAFITPFVLLANSFAEAGARLEQISAKTGIAVEALSSLEYAARASGLTLEQIADAAKGTNQFLQAAPAGGEDTRKVFRDLSLTFQELNSASPEERFRVLADRISRVPDPTNRAALAMKVFGEAGLQLLPMLNQGADGIARLEERARELGLVMSGSDARAAVELRTAIQTLWQIFTRLGQVIGASVTPDLLDFLTVINGLVGGAIRWINQNRELVAQVFRIGAVVVAAGAALMALGAVIYLGGIGIGVFTSLFGIATGVVTGFKVAVTALYAVLGLLPIALVAAGVAFLYFSGTGRSAVQDVSAGFGQLYETATGTWQGIVSAISAGDLELAFRVAVAGLKLLWAQTVAFLQTRWLEYTSGTSDTFSEASTEIGRMAIRGAAWVVQAGANAAQMLADAWVNVVSGIQLAFSRLGTFVEGVWARVIALISGGDVEQALADVAARGAEAERRIEEGRQAGLTRNANAGARSRELIGDVRDGLIEQLDQMQNERLRASQAEMDRRRRNINAPVAEARREFDAASLEAWIAGEDAWFRRQANAQSQIDPTGGPKAATVGTFSAEVAAGLGGNGPAERTAVATETTAANTRRILDAVRDGGFVWGN